MKPAAIALPVITFLAAGIWLGSQHRSISALEKQSEVLKKRIAAHDSAPLVVASASPRPTRETKLESTTKEKIDWKGVAELFMTMQRQGGVSDMRSMMRFQQQLQTMSADELVAALDEIARLDVPKDSLLMLEQMLMGPLSKKDPELALNRFIGRLEGDNGQAAWMLGAAMREWSKKDSTAAAAWLDRQIASGKLDSKSLDGKSRPRSMFEGQLIGALLESDPDAASARLGTLPEAQRADALDPIQSLQTEHQAAYAKMVREQLPADQQLGQLVRAASQIAVTHDYADVSGYMERISATPEERTAIVKDTAGDKLRMLSYNQKVTRGDVDKMRDWALSNSPNDADAATGKALAQVGQQQNENNSFADVAALAIQYHESSGNDEVLVSFLQSTNSHLNREQNRELAEKISDPQRREEILKRFK